MGLNSSYAWRSVCSSQDIVRRGLWWRIGDGLSITLWDDPWLNDDSTFFMCTPWILGLESMQVADLFFLGTRTWDMELLHEFFSVDDVTKILNTPATPSSIPNKVIWHFSNTGLYMVQSAYKMASSLVIDDAPVVNTSISRSKQEINGLTFKSCPYQ
ncbi:hypothetical protein ACS0TY_021743 [Phlomoides rotata]